MQETVAQGLTGRALGEAVIDHVLTFPEQHDQRDVVCGTAACIAGWAVLIHEGNQYVSGLWDAYFGTPGQYKTRLARYEAPRLLGVDSERFSDAVFDEMDRDAAIANFKHLLDETYSECAS